MQLAQIVLELNSRKSIGAFGFPRKIIVSCKEHKYNANTKKEFIGLKALLNAGVYRGERGMSAQKAKTESMIFIHNSFLFFFAGSHMGREDFDSHAEIKCRIETTWFTFDCTESLYVTILYVTPLGRGW